MTRDETRNVKLTQLSPKFKIYIPSLFKITLKTYNYKKGHFLKINKKNYRIGSFLSCTPYF